MKAKDMRPENHLDEAERLLNNTWEQGSIESATLQAEAHTILAQTKKEMKNIKIRDRELERLIGKAEYSLDNAYSLCYKVEDGLKIALGQAKLAQAYLRSKV